MNCEKNSKMIVIWDKKVRPPEINSCIRHWSLHTVLLNQNNSKNKGARCRHSCGGGRLSDMVPPPTPWPPLALPLVGAKKGPSSFNPKGGEGDPLGGGGM